MKHNLLGIGACFECQNYAISKILQVTDTHSLTTVTLCTCALRVNNTDGFFMQLGFALTLDTLIHAHAIMLLKPTILGVNHDHCMCSWCSVRSLYSMKTTWAIGGR